MTHDPPRKQGKDLVVGDVVHCGGLCRTITHFSEHPGFNGHTARVLNSGDFGITTFDDDYFAKLGNGAWIQTHLWFSEQRRLGYV